MPKNEIIIRIGGEGGEGVISTGDFFALGSARTGYHVFTFRTYPAEIRGGHAWYHARVGAKPVLSMGDGADVLVAFNTEAYNNHIDLLHEEGVLIYDPDTATPADGRFIKYPVPFNKIAKVELDFIRGKNVVVTGFLAGLFGLDPAPLEGLMRARFRRRPELMDQNLKSLYTGLEYSKKIEKADPYYLKPIERVGRLVMSGNDAIVAGALFAGCRFFAGYPITPASDIMESMAKELPLVGGAFLQAEDEISAIGSVIGASYAGVKAMTATSGPGMSLMTEFMGLSGMAEVPAIIVDAQRASPATGMPTKLEQGDLNHALYGGHGDYPRIVIAPGSVEDCFYQIINAFNMAEKYQTIAVFLSDQSLSQRTETMTPLNTAEIDIVGRLRPTPEELKDYQRFSITDTGISPMSLPGEEGGVYIAPGLEHDEYGFVEAPMKSRVEMTAKRFRKMENAQKELEASPRYGADDAEIGVIGWGSTEGVIREAVERAVEKGYRVAAMHPKVLCPLPEKELERFISSVKRVIVPELNYSGQFAKYLRATFGIKPIQLSKYVGLPFTPGEILKKIEEVVNHG